MVELRYNPNKVAARSIESTFDSFLNEGKIESWKKEKKFFFGTRYVVVAEIVVHAELIKKILKK